MLIKILHKSLILFLCQMLAYSPLLRAEQLSLPSGDIIAPEISQEKYVNVVEPGSDHNITVTVTDNVGVGQVILYYRVIDTKEYKRLTMNSINSSDEYQTTITSDLIKAPGIEYYVQAVDNAGNSVLHGYAFSPLSVKTDSNAAVLAAETSKATIEEESSNIWLWVGLGALAVIGAVAAGGGGGGGDPAQTETVIITGSTP